MLILSTGFREEISMFCAWAQRSLILPNGYGMYLKNVDKNNNNFIFIIHRIQGEENNCEIFK